MNPLFQNPLLAHVAATASRYEALGSLALFLFASFLMIKRLEALEKSRFEGTVLGTLIMPYCSGFSNLAFAFILGRTGGNGTLVLENCLVNNVTNLTLLLGLPALFWSMEVVPSRSRKKRTKAQKISHLSLLLTFIALIFFTGAVWSLARDGVLDFGDGLVLVGIFLFWQIFHIFDVLKGNVSHKRSFSWKQVIDLVLIVASGYAIYISIESMVLWVTTEGSGLLGPGMLGWLSGTLMILPNGLLAVYYAHAGRPEIVYSSQAGDGHICIPMCIGLFAIFREIQIPDFFQLGIVIICCAGLIHFFCLAFIGRLPRWLGGFLAGLYGFFLFSGLGGMSFLD